MIKIMYVEDHEVFGEQVIQHILIHYDVNQVTSLTQAYSQWELSGASYQLLLCDYDLPDGKGSEFIEKIRAQGVRLPIIAVSSHEEGNRALLEAGANAVCSKLEIPASLLDVIRRLLAQKAFEE